MWEFWVGVAVLLLLCWVVIDKGMKGLLICSGVLSILFLIIKYGGE